MLIVSQDKEVIINFERISELSLFKPFENDTEVWVYADETEIGVYKDSIRVHSIFKDILEKYSNCNAYGNGFIINDIYYMPKE